MSRHIHKVIFCLLLVSSLFSCGQGNKERSLPQNDQIKKITIFKQPEIMNDTLKPYLFIPTPFISNTNIKNKSYNIYIVPSHVQMELYIGDIPPFIGGFWGYITKENDSFSAQIPINSCILKSGKYKVVGRIYPRYGETSFDYHSYLQMEGYYRKSGDWEDKYPMFTIETSDTKYDANDKPYNPIVGFPYFELQTEIEVEVPYEVEGWSHSVNLKEQNEEELKKEMQQR
ncbi:hypothetical protein C4S77_06145, partial [Apibacter adventoris]